MKSYTKAMLLNLILALLLWRGAQAFIEAGATNASDRVPVSSQINE